MVASSKKFGFSVYTLTKEPLNTIIISLIIFFNLSPQFLFLAYSALTAFFFYQTSCLIHKHFSKSAALLFGFLWFAGSFLYSLNSIRQGLAALVITYMFVSLIVITTPRRSAVTLYPVFIHFSSLIPIFLLKLKFQSTKRNLYFILFCTVLAGIILVNPLVFQYLVAKLSRYGVERSHLLQLLSAVVLIWVVSQRLKNNFRNFSVVILLAYFMTISSEIEGLRRLSIYFKHFSYIIICYYYCKVTNPNQRLIVLLTALVFNIYIFGMSVYDLNKNARNYDTVEFNFQIFS